MALPLDSSLSSGCLRAVMSRKVHKKRTTTSRSFLMGAICNSSQSGEPAAPITTNYTQPKTEIIFPSMESTTISIDDYSKMRAMYYGIFQQTKVNSPYWLIKTNKSPPGGYDTTIQFGWRLFPFFFFCARPSK